jgi:hypothetical protein
LLGAASALVGVLVPRTGRGVEQLEAGPHQGLVHRFVAHADVRLGAGEARAVALEQPDELVPRKLERLDLAFLNVLLLLLLLFFFFLEADLPALHLWRIFLFFFFYVFFFLG